MSFAAELRKEIQTSSRKIFDAAVDEVLQEWEDSPEGSGGGPSSLPFDTGFLRSQLRTSNRSVTSDVMRITISLEAKNDGFDYASFLNRAGRVRITPKKAKALRWFGPGGEAVFAQKVEYTNKWQGFWERWWRSDENRVGGGRWFDALQSQSERTL